MSFREKSAWVCFLSTVAVFVPYFGYVIRWNGRGELGSGSMVWALIGAVVVQSTVGIVAHMWFAIFSRQESKDERDRAIESRSIRYGYYVLCSSVFLVVMLAIGSSMTSRAEVPGRLMISQYLLFGFVVAETTRYLTQVVGYRAGA